MHKFEDIMGMRNYEAFRALVSSANSGHLTCYIGAGLSLYSKRWGEPFEMIVNDLIKYACDPTNPSPEIKRLKKHLNELYLLRYSLDMLRAKCEAEKRQAKQKLLNVYQASEDEIKKYQRKRLYPKIGNSIEDILLDSKLHIASCTSQVTDTFNHWFCKELDILCKQKQDIPIGTELELSGRPYSFASIYYLPYIKKCLRFITTNCDSSFHDIGSFLQKFDENINANWISDHDSSERTDWSRDLRAPGMFYIHGFHLNPDSLIMTQKAYDAAYGTHHSAVVFLQQHAAANYTLLFLGASLERDRTVDAINRQLQVQAEKPHLVVISTSKKEPGLSGGMRLFIPENDYTDISIILHQLIRESCVRNEASYSWQQDLSGELASIPPIVEDATLSEWLSEFLGSNFKFDVKVFQTQHRIEILQYLQNHCLNKNGRLENGEAKGGPTWTLCQIKSGNFTLDLPGPLHNYPLGNTIYVIGGTKCDKNDSLKLTSEIVHKFIGDLRSWHEKTYPTYPDSERFSDKSGDLKIRIIRFDAEMSEEEKSEVWGSIAESYVNKKTSDDVFSNDQEDKYDQFEFIRKSMIARFPDLAAFLSYFAKLTITHALANSEKDIQTGNSMQSINEDTYTKILKRVPDSLRFGVSNNNEYTV